MKKFFILTSSFFILLLLLAAARPGAFPARWLTLQSDADGQMNSFTNLANVISSNVNAQIITGPATNQFGAGGGGGILTNGGSGINNAFTNSALWTAASVEVTNLNLAGLADAHDNLWTNLSTIWFHGESISGGFVSDGSVGSIYINSLGSRPYGESYTIVAGGAGNDIGQYKAYSSIIGGYNNRIGTDLNDGLSDYSMIGGGVSNKIYGGLGRSFAAGTQADVEHGGTFIWADPHGGYFTSTGTNQFLIRAAGGVGILTNNPGGYALNVYGRVNATGGFYSNGIPLGFGGGGGGNSSLTNAIDATVLTMGATYTNNTASNLVVRVSMLCTPDATHAATGYIKVDENQSGTFSIAATCQAGVSAESQNIVGNLSASVAPGGAYQLTNGAGGGTASVVLASLGQRVYSPAAGSGGGGGVSLAQTYVGAGGGIKVSTNVAGSDYTVFADTNVMDSRVLIAATALTNLFTSGAGANSNSYVGAGGGIKITTNLAGQVYTAHLNTNVVFGLMDVFAATGNVFTATTAANVTTNVSGQWQSYATALAAGNTAYTAAASNSLVGQITSATNNLLKSATNIFQRVPTNSATTGYVLSATGNDAKWVSSLSSAPVTLYKSSSSGTITGTAAETDMHSVTIAAGQLGTDFQSLEFSGAGRSLDTTGLALKTFRLYFAGKKCFEYPYAAYTEPTFWQIHATVMRQSSTVVYCSVYFTPSRAAGTPWPPAGTGVTSVTNFTVANLDSTASTFKMTGQLGDASGNLATGFARVQFIP